MIKANCDYCGKEIKIYPSQEKYKNHFCSKKCADKFQRRNQILVKCCICGKEIGYMQKVIFEKNFRGEKVCSAECKEKNRIKNYFKPNRYEIINNEYIKIYFDNTKHADKVGFLDINDIDILKKHRLSVKPNGHLSYICFVEKGKKHKLHRYLLGVKENEFVDHINGNGLDNRRKNLRICTQLENTQNKHITQSSKSGFRNVHFHKKTQSWHVVITVNKKHYSFGYYKDIEEAKLVAETKRKELMPFSTL